MDDDLGNAAWYNGHMPCAYARVTKYSSLLNESWLRMLPTPPHLNHGEQPPSFWTDHILRDTAVLREDFCSLVLAPFNDEDNIDESPAQQIYHLYQQFVGINNRVPPLEYIMNWPDIQAALGLFATKLELASRALSWAKCDVVGSNHYLTYSSSPFPPIDGCLRWNYPCFQ